MDVTETERERKRKREKAKEIRWPKTYVDKSV